MIQESASHKVTIRCLVQVRMLKPSSGCRTSTKQAFVLQPESLSSDRLASGGIELAQKRQFLSVVATTWRRARDDNTIHRLLRDPPGDCRIHILPNSRSI